MTMTTPEQASRTTTSYHYVLTLSTQEGATVRQVTQYGTLTAPAGAGVTRTQMLEQAEKSTRRDYGIDPSAPINVLFWSLEPNEL